MLKSHFWRAVFAEIGCVDSEEVTLQLIKSKYQYCYTVLKRAL